jgi:hypothetical protein
MPVKVFYYTKDKEGFALPDETYESIEEDLFLWQHINNARKQAGVPRERFFIINTSCSPRKKSTWVNPDWPLVPFPSLKKTRLAFGRYVIEKAPEPVDPDYD